MHADLHNKSVKDFPQWPKRWSQTKSQTRKMFHVNLNRLQFNPCLRLALYMAIKEGLSIIMAVFKNNGDILDDLVKITNKSQCFLHALTFYLWRTHLLNLPNPLRVL